jgi:2'-5' RNA ligase
MAPTVIIVPVPEAEPAVDLLRRANTPDGAEGMPAHVTLIYPFTDDSQLVAGRIAEVRAVLERFSAFEFVLSEVRRFDNLPNESYVWLAPTPSGPFVEMVDELASTFPEHPPFSGAFATVIPHLTVAASTDEDLLDRVANQAADAIPFKARAETACIMQRVGGLWRLRAEFPLATS